MINRSIGRKERQRDRQTNRCILSYFSMSYQVYLWLNNLSCSECPPGYTGVGCTVKCSHPYYGDECSSKCDCPYELCDFVLGCEYISTQGKMFFLKKMIMLLYILLTFLLIKCHVHSRQAISHSFLKSIQYVYDYKYFSLWTNQAKKFAFRCNFHDTWTVL